MQRIYEDRYVKCQYLNGKLHGEYYRYDSNGKLWFQTKYNKGLLDGEYIIYDDKMNIMLKKNIKEEDPFRYMNFSK